MRDGMQRGQGAGLAWVGVMAASFVAQGQVQLTGLVVDNLTQKGVAGASVTVLAKNVTAQTDASGAFSLGGSTGIRQVAEAGRAHSPVPVEVYAPTGAWRATWRPGLSGEGRRPGLARLPDGVYVYQNVTKHPESQGTVPGVPTGAEARAGVRARLAKAGARQAVVDSLIVTKPGYYTARLPLEQFVQSGLKVMLTDSAAAAGATWIPDAGWSCGKPGGLASPSLGTQVFQITLNVGKLYDVGQTPYGRRRLRVISGGSISGDRLQGTVHTGGLDYDLSLANGVGEIEQIVVLRSQDGANIYVRGLGVAPTGEKTSRVVLDFEAANGSAYAWLNTGSWMGVRTLDPGGKSLKLVVFDMAKAAVGDPKLTVVAPAGVARQSADCLKLTGSRGAVVFTENVTLGASFSIASKRGTRNIIPITGGTTTGKVAGQIVSGGADYQLNGLDARYALAPNDGEFILVRNCGNFGSMVPQFEARADGPYAFLNAASFLSGDPVTGGVGVGITFYERK